MRATGKRFVKLTKFGMPIYLKRRLGGYDMESNTVTTLCVEEG